MAWVAGVVTAQLGRTRLVDTARAVVARTAVARSSAARGHALAAAATLLVGGVQGAVQVARGRTTGAQFLRDTGVAAAGTAAGTASAVLIASAVSGPLGGVIVLVGSAVAGQLATTLGEAALGRVIRSDREKLLDVIDPVIATLVPANHDRDRLRDAVLAALQPQVRPVLTARDAEARVRALITSQLAPQPPTPRPTAAPRRRWAPTLRKRRDRREPRPWG